MRAARQERSLSGSEGCAFECGLFLQGLPVGEQRLWVVLRVHGAPLESFSQKLLSVASLERLSGATAPSAAAAFAEGSSPMAAGRALPRDALLSTGLAGVSTTASFAAPYLFGGGTLLQPEGPSSLTTGPAAFSTHQHQSRSSAPSTVYESSRFPVLLPNQETVTITKALQLKEGDAEQLLPPGVRRIARAEALSQRRSRKSDSMFSEMHIAADVSRRQITVFAPYFFENLTEATLSVSGMLVPSRCRLYTTEEEMRAATIRAYKVDIWGDRLLTSNVARKQDMSGISTTK